MDDWTSSTSHIFHAMTCLVSMCMFLRFSTFIFFPSFYFSFLVFSFVFIDEAPPVSDVNLELEGWGYRVHIQRTDR